MATSTAAIPRPKIAVIGAGLTGLIAAHGLQKNGFPVTVYERGATLTTPRRDWTILIHWAMPILASLLPEAALANFPKAICNPHLAFGPEVECLPCLNGVTGEPLFNSPTPGARRVTRQALREVLVEGLDVQWGRTLASVKADEGGVVLGFADGEEVAVDYVLGADGASSKVRELLLGAEASMPQLSEFMFASGIMKYGDAEKVKKVVETHPVSLIYFGKTSTGGHMVFDVGDTPEDMSSWTTSWAKIWKGPTPSLQGQEAIEYVLKNYNDVVEPFKSIVEWTPEGSRCYIDPMKYWVSVPYPNPTGRVALAGDAAHPMLPFRGQGLQHAITDVANYVEALLKIEASAGAATRQEVMAAYDTEMVPRGAKAVLQANEEAEKAFGMENVEKMLMARQGHGKHVD